uniref:Uncharacterized protein n=1 Tax=Takifugu rubripes TaxID=31033 RepID=A0A674NL00_TAKRU
QQCKSAPISLGHHSCSSDSPSHPLACTPSPCRGSGHLGIWTSPNAPLPITLTTS